MAHSKNFFGLRRGSTASHTYTVQHGSGPAMASHASPDMGTGGGIGNVQVTKDKSSKHGIETFTLASYKHLASVYTASQLWNVAKGYISALMRVADRHLLTKDIYNQYTKMNTSKGVVQLTYYPVMPNGCMGAGEYWLCQNTYGDPYAINIQPSYNDGKFLWPLAYAAYQLMGDGGSCVELSRQLIAQGTWQEGDKIVFYAITSPKNSTRENITYSAAQAHFIVDTKAEPSYNRLGRIYSFTKNGMLAVCGAKAIQFDADGTLHNWNDTVYQLCASTYQHDNQVASCHWVVNRQGFIPRISAEEGYQIWHGQFRNSDKYLNGGDGWSGLTNTDF